MDSPKRRRHSSALVAVAVLMPLVAYVVYATLHIAEFECAVCMVFEGQEVCRNATGSTEEEGVRTGVTNACALLTSGMTNMMRCERAQPAKTACKKL